MARTDEEIDIGYGGQRTTWISYIGDNQRDSRVFVTIISVVTVDKEPPGSHTLEIIREIQEREVEMLKMKKKQQELVAEIFVLGGLMMNMDVNTMNDVTVADIEDYE
ncbi:hypothetical protein AG4045_016365 [Apium graveolens]|uniref:Uncharacterized protein n=1 Tax=Apium graveolens TaxID=4045 RepID=A0A6L5B9P3_APIGR|nr:hypothetical protein AG4045_016365 [Apium graveolens]